MAKKIRYVDETKYKYLIPAPFEDRLRAVEKAELEKEYKRERKVPLETRRYLFECKDTLLRENGYTPISPIEFPVLLYDRTELQESNKPGEDKGKACGLITTRKKRKDKNGNEVFYEERVQVRENGYETVYEALKDANTSTLLFPFTVYGKRHTKAKTHQTVAVVIDIDYVWEYHLGNILHQIDNGLILPPTYIANSGNGVHLYYKLEKPLNMTEAQGRELLKLKRLMINYLWNSFTSAAGEKRDNANVYQGFRMPGAPTKLIYNANDTICEDADKYICTVFRKGEKEPLYTLTQLRDMCPVYFDAYFIKEYGDDAIPDMRILEADLPWDLLPKSRMSLEEAKEKYPDWFETKIEKKPRKDKRSQKDIEDSKRCGYECQGFQSSPKMYEWWKHKIELEAVDGGRYFSLCALVQIGKKCRIPKEQIEEDARSFLEFLDSKSKSNSIADRFTPFDIECALKTMYSKKAYLSTRAYMQDTSKIPIPPQRRNGRTQEVHLKRARAVRALESYENVGRPDKQTIVETWQSTHPSGKKADCIRDTGLTKPTVYKWWK